MSEPNITEIVRDKYAKAALRVTSGEGGCCGTASSRSGCDPVTGNLYATEETTALPEEAVRASLGCGNPTALAQLRPGRGRARPRLRRRHRRPALRPARRADRARPTAST